MIKTTIEAAKEKLVAVAKGELGYREGANNYTKYAADPGIAKLYGWIPQNQPWCGTFVNWCFLTAFGYDVGSRLTFGGSAACRNAADLYKAAGAWVHFPEVGDQAFYCSGGAINHTGIVVAVEGSTITAVEGNFSDKVSSVRHNIGASDVAGFGRPCWKIVEDEKGQGGGSAGGSGSAGSGTVSEPDTETPATALPVCLPVMPQICQGDKGTPVERLQTLLIGRGYYCGGRSYSGREHPDGDFGPATLVAVKDVQKSAGLQQDGIVGALTWPVLILT